MPVSTFDLLCGEDAGALLEAPGSPAGGGGSCDHSAEFPSDSDESMAGFIEGEAAYSPGSDYPDRFRSNSLDPFARNEAIAWIIKVAEFYGFRPLTAYLSVNYMDRFLSSHRLPQTNGWVPQLLSVACLSLAAKMEETLVPSLLDLQVEGARFIFEPRTICRMELIVLTALKWRLRSVTPFTFIDFFASKVDPTGANARYLVSRATQIILSTIHDIDFLGHCPSSIAAAAMLCATDETPDLALFGPGNAVTWCIGLTKEGITNCYQLMQQVVVHKRKPPMILSQLRVTSPLSMSSGVSSSASSPPTKRRKLSSTSCLQVDDDQESSGEIKMM